MRKSTRGKNFIEKYGAMLFGVIVATMIAGCGSAKDSDMTVIVTTDDSSVIEQSVVVVDDYDTDEPSAVEVSDTTDAAGIELTADVVSVAEESVPKADTVEPQILEFVDVFGELYETVIRDDIPKHEYSNEAFVRDGEKLVYEDEQYTSRLGIDVSRYQGRINWEKVKADGYEFAFIRIGFRGYGKAGEIHLDQRFHENIRNAQAAGVDVGVYFFSQAISEEEALEEAQFVMNNLEGYELQLPVVYDPESILDHEARTDDVSGEQFTRNTRVFCDAIREGGFEPMIYSNMLWEAFEFDLEVLQDIPIWYADYEDFPQTPYYFTYWQYTNEGRIKGIDGLMDIDIQMIRK